MPEAEGGKRIDGMRRSVAKTPRVRQSGGGSDNDNRCGPRGSSIVQQVATANGGLSGQEEDWKWPLKGE